MINTHNLKCVFWKKRPKLVSELKNGNFACQQNVHGGGGAFLATCNTVLYIDVNYTI
jgi:hypothetical protein